MTATREDVRHAVRAAVAALDTLVALMCLIQYTGDRTLLRRYADVLDGTHPRIDRFVGRTQAQGVKSVPQEVDSEIRESLIDTLLSDRRPRIPRPDDALFAEMARLATGMDVDISMVPYFMEQAGFITDMRDVPSVNLPPEDFTVLIVGAGMVGINAGVKLAEAGFSYRILEAEDGVGGTWWINRYPRAAVDTPAVGYSFSFEPNLEWSRYYPNGDEYQRYLEQVAAKYGVDQNIDFGTRMLSSCWDEADQMWTVTAQRAGEVVSYRANVVVTALGHLNRPFIPELHGRESFGGFVAHTTEWGSHADQATAGKRVVLVGTGCTSAQVAVGIADQVEHLTILQRQTQWYLPNDLIFQEVPEAERAAYGLVPFSYQWVRARTVIEQAHRARDYLRFDPEWHRRTGGFSEANDRIREIGLTYLRHKCKERPDLIDVLTPDFPPFAKRPVIDPGYLDTLLRPDVSLVTGDLCGFTSGSVLLRDGTTIECDAVILATGFTLDYLRTFDIIGRDGANLAQQWDARPTAYLGIAVPGFPNFFVTSGPNSGASGSGHSMMGEEQVHYLVETLQMMVNEGLTSIEVTSVAAGNYQSELDEGLDQTVWKRSGGAHTYFLQGGDVVLGYPKPNVEYWRASRRPDMSHFAVRRSS